jgi:hypothetical protein
MAHSLGFESKWLLNLVTNDWTGLCLRSGQIESDKRTVKTEEMSQLAGCQLTADVG